MSPDVNATKFSNLPGPLVLADPGRRTAENHGLKSRSLEWSRPPEPRPLQAGYWCSRFARRPDVRLIWRGKTRSRNRAWTLDTEIGNRSLTHALMILFAP